MKLFFVLLFSFTAIILPQELNCTVTLNTDNIPNQNRELLSTFGQEVADYMNMTKFTNEDWGGDKIKCSLNIFILSASSDVSYTAQVVVSSQRPIYKSDRNSLMLSINDNNWTFTYQSGQPMYANQNTYDAVTSFLDFYAYLIIGFDKDSWDQPLAGTPYFVKAADIANLGASSKFSKGWESSSSSFSRRGLVEDLLNEKYRPFREALYDYYYGIDYYSTNPKEAVKHIVKLVKTLESLKAKMDLNSVLIKTFFDAKSGEIIQYLKNYPDKSIFVSLKKIDPSHISKYNEAMSDESLK